MAHEDYEKAYSRTADDSYYHWSPKLIEKVINGYGLPKPNSCDEIFKVTDPQCTTGKQYYRNVDRDNYNDNRIGYVKSLSMFEI